MELKTKDYQAPVATSQLMVVMQWSTTDDFDLAVVYETKNGKYGIVYFGDLGDLDDFPYIQLLGDETGENWSGDNEEILRIRSVDVMNYLWIFCWDYELIQTGRSIQLRDTNLQIVTIDSFGNRKKIKFNGDTVGNVWCVVGIDNTDTGGAKLINMSKTGLLTGLSTLEQLLEIIHSPL